MQIDLSIQASPRLHIYSRFGKCFQQIIQEDPHLVEANMQYSRHFTSMCMTYEEDFVRVCEDPTSNPFTCSMTKKDDCVLFLEIGPSTCPLGEC